MPRKTKHNYICKPELIDQFHEQNKFLKKSFLNYLKAVDRSSATIEQYSNDLDIFFCWNVEENDNKPFTQISKKELIKFQGKALGEWEWSSNRIRREKSTLSSLSNYIENILDEDEEFKGFKSIIKKISNPVNIPVREPTVLQTEDLEYLLGYLVEHKRFKQACCLSLAMNSGRRKAELPRFKTKYFRNNNVIYGSIYKTPEKVKTKGAGTTGKMIYLYTLKHPFDPYLKLWMDERKEKGIESEWLFPKSNDVSKPMPSDTLGDWAKQFSKILNKDFYWHCVRHYLTTQFAKFNLPFNVIKEFFGWGSVDMVDVYNDQSADDVLGLYFDDNGIKVIQQATLTSL